MSSDEANKSALNSSSASAREPQQSRNLSATGENFDSSKKNVAPQNPQSAQSVQPSAAPPRDVGADQLMKLLDAQLAEQRKARFSGDSRMAFRVWSLIVILAGVIVSLCILQWMLSQLPKPEKRSGASTPAQMIDR